MIGFQGLSDMRPYPTHEDIPTSQMTSYAMDAACELRTSKPFCIVKSRKLWIEAICISQEDLEECCPQVRYPSDSETTEMGIHSTKEYEIMKLLVQHQSGNSAA